MVERNRSERGGSNRGREGNDRPARGEDRGSRTERGNSRSSGSSARFEYRKPTQEDVKRRAEQSGKDFDAILKDDVKTFKVNDGDNMIRVMPPTWADPKHFGFDIFVHYQIGPDSQSYLCLQEMKGEACPICEERARAVKNKEDDYAKELKPSKRVLLYIIDRDNEKEGVQAWAAPWTVDRDINSLIVDKRSGDVLGIDDPENGYDISFNKQGKAMTTKYIGMQIARRESDLGNTAWLDFAVDHPLPDQLQYFSYEHIADVFGGKSSKTESDGDRLDREQDSGLRHVEEKSSRGKAEDSLTWDGVHTMTYDELCDLIDAENLSIKPEDSVNDAELADWVCADMKISKRTERTQSRDAGDSSRAKLTTMRRKVE
jgi:hypothetical protein